MALVELVLSNNFENVANALIEQIRSSQLPQVKNMPNMYHTHGPEQTHFRKDLWLTSACRPISPSLQTSDLSRSHHNNRVPKWQLRKTFFPPLAHPSTLLPHAGRSVPMGFPAFPLNGEK